MILTRILDHLSERRIASLPEIARAVDSAPDAARSMLEHLQRRGLVHRVRANSACGSSCGQCLQPGGELYGYGPAAPEGERGDRPLKSRSEAELQLSAQRYKPCSRSRNRCWQIP